MAERAAGELTPVSVTAAAVGFCTVRYAAATSAPGIARIQASGTSSAFRGGAAPAWLTARTVNSQHSLTGSGAVLRTCDYSDPGGAGLCQSRTVANARIKSSRTRR